LGLILGVNAFTLGTHTNGSLANSPAGGIVLHSGTWTGGNGETATFVAVLGALSSAQEASEQLADVIGATGTQVTTSTVGSVQTAIGNAMGAATGQSRDLVSNGLTPMAGGVRYQGMSAGDGFEFPFGFWATYDHSDFDDDTGGLGLDGDTNAVLVGGDFSPWEGTVFGVALGYEDSAMDTFFNGGDLEMDGFSVIPYAAVYLSDHVGVDFDLTADFLLGYSSIDVSTTRSVGGALVSGSTDSTRRFFAGNVTAGVAMGAMYLSGTGGFLVARDELDGFVDSGGTAIAAQRTEFGQLSVGGEAAYAWARFEPYVTAQWMYAYEREESTVVSDDANSAQLGLGVRYFGESFSGTLGYSTIVGRDDYSQGTISAQVRAEF